jgi:hypothetical protein
MQTLLVQLAGEGSCYSGRRSLTGCGCGSVPASNPIGPEGRRKLAERTIEVLLLLWPQKWSRSRRLPSAARMADHPWADRPTGMEAKMKLSAEQVRQGIVHPEQVVRDCALRYFSESFSDDPTVMPLAIQAIETYGWNDAFEYHQFLDHLAQTEDTLLWLIDRLNRMGRPQTHEQAELCYRLASVIASADVALLMKHEQSILGLEGLEAAFRDVIADRLRLMTVDSDACWQDLERLCEQHKGVHYINEFPTSEAFRLCEAIARDGACADRVLSILSLKSEDPENNPMIWVECFAARLAGEMRLEAAVPFLVGKLKDDGGDLMNEECQRSFVKVGTDAAVDTICQGFTAAPWHYRLYASSSLACIRSDLVVAKCLELLQQEQSGEMVEANLIRATLQNFSSDGIERGRQYTLAGDKEVRRELLAAATLTGVAFSELEEWRDQERRAAEDRRRRREALSAPAPKPRPQSAPTPPAFSSLTDPAPVSPITRKEKVGRNDPCPCGSGKKFKKCCMNKEA